MKSRQELLEELEEAKEEAKEEEVKISPFEKLRVRIRGFGVPNDTEILFVSGNIDSEDYIAILGNKNESYFILIGTEILNSLERNNGIGWVNKDIQHNLIGGKLVKAEG